MSSVMKPSTLDATLRHTLSALIDTLFPPSALPDGVALSKLGAVEAFEALTANLTWRERTDLLVLLRLLSTGVGTAALAHTWPTAFASLAPAERERVLLRLGASSVALRRKALHSLKALIGWASLTFVPDGAAANPVWGDGYPGPAHVRALAPRADPLQTHAPDGSGVVECDVVIVGSGAGGGCAAAVLAQAGLSVVVLEKGAYVRPSQIDGLEGAGFNTLYEKGGLMSTADQSMGILAGATLGGGTTVNWACCLETPAYVRDEWAAAGLPQFAPGAPGFDTALQAITARIGATADGVVHNKANRLLADGCGRLGYPWKTIPQNLADGGKGIANGWTAFGSRDGNKQGTLVTYLADAAAAGARVVAGCAVEKILTAPTGNDGRRATGVAARTADGARLEVRARVVVASAGALHTPALLQRSGVGGPHVGRHLRLHPVTACVGTFEEPVKLYEGAPMTVLSTVAEMGPKADGYGARLEVPCTHPGLVATGAPWRGGEDFLQMFGEMRHAAAAIVLQRDGGGGGDGGRVRDGGGPAAPVSVEYELTEADEASMLDALEAAARAWVAAGATKLDTFLPHVAPLEVAPSLRGRAAPGENPPLDGWVAQLRTSGLRKRYAGGLLCAHQMGSCRMGADATTSVVDEDGEVWEVDDLHVFDTSIFPTASGSNPMITTLATAHMLATRLAARLNAVDSAAQRRRRAARREQGRLARPPPKSAAAQLGEALMIVAIVALALAWAAALLE